MFDLGLALILQVNGAVGRNRWPLKSIQDVPGAYSHRLRSQPGAILVLQLSQAETSVFCLFVSEA